MALQVEVIDTGIGFSDADEAFLYHQFRQVDGSMTRRYGGLGIGLALVKQLGEMHDGAIELASEGPGQGSCFTVRLPIAA